MYVLLESNQTRIYHNKYGAQNLDQALLDGPDKFISKFTSYTLRGVNDLNLIHVAEGLVFIEPNNKQIFFDGGELFTCFDPDHRRLWIKILEQIWQGWEINYLYDNFALAKELNLRYDLNRNANPQTLWRDKNWWDITSGLHHSILLLLG